MNKAQKTYVSNLIKVDIDRIETYIESIGNFIKGHGESDKKYWEGKINGARKKLANAQKSLKIIEEL